MKKFDKDFLIFVGLMAGIVGLVIGGFIVKVAIWRHFLCS